MTNWMTAAIAYFIIHIVTFFLSYLIHVVVTFKRDFSWQGIRGYFIAVIGFKIFDYAIFNAILAAFTVTAPVGVFVASSLEAILKFFVVRHFLMKPSEKIAIDVPIQTEQTLLTENGAHDA